MLNKDILKGKWEKAKGMLRQQWAKLTDDDIEAIKGQAEELRGRLQERYGYSREEAEKKIEEFYGKVG